MASAQGRRLGVIGLGRMGSAICERLVAQGFEVLGHDLRPELRDRAATAGAGWASSVPEVAARSDVVVTALPGDDEVDAVSDPLLAGLAPGAAWIDLSSATPATARSIAASGSKPAAGAPVRVVDAPVGGGPADAREGRLLAFAGGSPADVAAVSDVLQAVAARVLHVGAHGSGYLTKLLVNLLW